MTNFNFTFQPGVSSEQMIGFEMAGRIWSQYLKDDAVFNIHIAKSDELPPTVVGGALPVYIATDIETMQNAMEQDATSADDVTALSNLNSQIDAERVTQYSAILNDTLYQSSDLSITRANAKALGLETLIEPSSIDGYVLFNSLDNSSFAWDYDFSRKLASSSRQIDFLSMALHELGHIMGFTSGVDVIGDITNQANLGQTSLLDLFRYSNRSTELNAREITSGQAAYFSIDGGRTQIAPMAEGLIEVSGGIEGYQASHWAYQSPVSSDLTPEIPEFELNTAFLDLINISAPVTPRDAQLAETLQITEFLGTNEVDIGPQTNTTILENVRQATYNSLGIMDPAIVPGSRSNISSLDLQALDVVGYNLGDLNVSLDYAALLQETQTALAQTVGVEVSTLDENLGTSSFIRDRQTSLSGAIANNQKLFERRRSSVRTRRWVFWQEDGLDPAVVNIVSDGAGDIAQIAAVEGRNQVTTVQAIPYAQLFFRSDTLIGSDVDDYIYPILPAKEFLEIDAGSGNDIVFLGRFSADVTAAEGDDTIIGVDSRSSTLNTEAGYSVDAGEGDNYVFLTSEITPVSVVAGEGDDYITVGSDNSVIKASGGSNQIYSYGLFGIGINDINDLAANAAAQDASLVSTPNSHSIDTGEGNDSIYLLTRNAVVTTSGGDNSIHIQGAQNSRITLSAGDGNDEITLVSSVGTVDAGDGNNVVTITDNLENQNISANPLSDGFSVITGKGSDVVRLSVSQAQVFTGGGNDVVDIASGRQSVTTGTGNDLIILGDTQGSYTRFGTQALIADFSAQDALLLHGTLQDYQLSSNSLYYQGRKLADFEGGANFSLENSQVFFTATSLGNDLAEQVGVGPDRFAKPRSPLDVDNEIRPLEERYNARREDRPISYEISGGEDAALFSIDPATGDVRFKVAPNARAPLDANGDNIYDVIVRATLGDGQNIRDIDTQQLAVSVSSNSIENPINLPRSQPSQVQVETQVVPDTVVSANNIIQGSIGNDALVGTSDNDQLLGIGGIDYLEGGAGADQFILGDASGSFYTQTGWSDSAYIEDFKAGVDQLVLAGSIDNYTTESDGKRSLLYAGDDYIAYLKGVTDLDLSAVKYVS
ncbi:MAG: NF038122 family metalloprotease [Phormidesmis sp.]